MDPSNATLPAEAPPFDVVSSTVASNASSASSALDLLAQRDFLLVEIKLILSSLAIIYVGAHGSLRRPPSASPPKSCGSRRDRRDADAPFSQGLIPSDAITFPLMAAGILMGLYYLLQWLKDPDILSRILRGYMSIVGVASLSSLYAHALELLAGFVFPLYWRDVDGTLVKISAYPGKVIRFPAHDHLGSQRLVETGRSPLPGRLSRVKFSEARIKMLWGVRSMLVEPFKASIAAYGFGSEKFRFKFTQMVAVLLAIATSVAFHSTNSTWLSNLVAYGHCYGSFLILSPTTFATGSLVLVGLFFYDIIMVFYTPYMITVATKLDVPIKLSFESASRSSILGLGDIVVPGIVIGLALRFDHWLHYHRQLKLQKKQLKKTIKDEGSSGAISTDEERFLEIKPTYQDLSGSWGDWFWTWTLKDSARLGNAMPHTVMGATFRKRYFYSSMIGYMLGMLVTLIMLAIFRHGQPALLYLVPGVVGSLWLTGLVSGEIKEMWMFTEDGSLDTKDVVVEVDGNGKVVKAPVGGKDGESGQARTDDKDARRSPESACTAKDVKSRRRRRHQPIFVFSLEAPNWSVENDGLRGRSENGGKVKEQ